MSYDWDGGTLSMDVEQPVCFGGIHFTFRFLFGDPLPVFGQGAYQSLKGFGLIDNVHKRVVFRQLLRVDENDHIQEFLPFIVVTEVSVADVIPEPWNPAGGTRGRFPLEPFRTAQYRTNQPGPGLIGLYLLDAAKYKGTEDDFPLGFGKNSIHITFIIKKATVAGSQHEPISLRVGDRRAIPMDLFVTGEDGFGRVFESPFALRFASPEAFQCNRVTDWNTVVLSAVRRALTDRWGIGGHGPLPFAIDLEHESVTDGADSPVRFYSIEDGKPGVGLRRDFGPAVGPEGSRPEDANRLIIRGRREGSGRVRVSAGSFTTPDRFPAESIVAQTVDVNVAAAALTLDTGPDIDGESLGDGTIILEDFWDGVALRGSFAFSVRAPMPNASSYAPVTGEWLHYDSGMERALLIGKIDPYRLSIRELHVHEEAAVWEHGRKVRRPFGIEMVIRDPGIVKFELPPKATVDSAGEFIYFGPLKHILRAVGPGETQVSIEVVLPPEPIADEFVVYDMPAVDFLTVKVPDPLVAEVHLWTDEWFSGAGSTDNPIDLSDPAAAYPDLIYNSGFLKGAALNHNPHSDSETIELVIERPGQPPQTIDLLAHEAVGDDGAFEFEVTELRRVGNDGDNTFTVRASKPINLVVNGAPDEESRTLTGVLPVVNTPAVFGVGPTILRRDIGSTSFRYSRALWAVLSDEVISASTGGSSTTDVSPEYDISYEPQTITLDSVVLPAIPGDHRVSVIARNEFGETVDSGETFFAPLPVASSNSNDWSIEPSWYSGGFYGGATVSGGSTGLKVGNSATAVIATAWVRYALVVERVDGSASSTIASDDADTPAGYDPMAERTFDVRVPRTGDLQADAWTEVTIRAVNEFGLRSFRARAHRRGDHYYWKGAYVTLNMAEHELRMDVTVRLPDGTVETFPDQGDFWDRAFPDGRSNDSLAYDRISWDIFRLVRDDNDNLVREPASSDMDISDVGVAEDPDYYLLVPLYTLTEDQVVSGQPTVDWLLYDASMPDIHFYNPVRVQDWVTQIPVWLYGDRWVDAPFESD